MWRRYSVRGRTSTSGCIITHSWALNKFYMYVPTLHYHEAHFDAPHEVRSCWPCLARKQVTPSAPL